MELSYKSNVMKLFNLGKLKIQDAKWYTKQGYALICADGKVIDIVKEDE